MISQSTLAKCLKAPLLTFEGLLSLAKIDAERRKDIMRNHTATHLLQRRCARSSGGHVKQSGSLVEPDRLSLRFRHYKALIPKKSAEVEKIVQQESWRPSKSHEEKPVGRSDEIPARWRCSAKSMAIPCE